MVGAERELKEAWKSVVRQSLHKKGADNGLTWVFGPADAPWYQGAVESMVSGAKRAIKFAVNNQRLSASEFLTVCSEVSNLLNERPIGTLPGADSELNILTPNSLLLGRAIAKNPGGWQPQGNNPRNRYYLVQRVIDEFWRKWTELYAPALVIRRQWNTVSLLRSAKSRFFTTTLEKNKNNPKGIWKTIKALISDNKHKCCTINNGQTLNNTVEMAETFNLHFSTIADRLRSLIPSIPFDTSKLGNFVRSRIDESVTFSIPSITETDVIGFLLKIDSNKSTGIDGISSRMLKLAAPIIAPSLAKLINL